MSAVRLRIGPLSGVEPMLLESAFEAAKAGTVAGAATLSIERTAIVIVCRACGHGGQARPDRLACPGCGSLETTLTGGDECTLVGLTVRPRGAEE